MALLEQILGISFLFVGLLGLTSYAEDLASLRLPIIYRGLGPMQQRWGKTLGTGLHLVGYVLPPIAFGILFLSGKVL